MYRVFEKRGKRKGKKKKINTRQRRLVTFYRLYRRKIKLMERREEGGLTETGKEKARKQETSFETYASILSSDDKKRVKRVKNASRDISLRYILRIY